MRAEWHYSAIISGTDLLLFGLSVTSSRPGIFSYTCDMFLLSFSGRNYHYIRTLVITAYSAYTHYVDSETESA
jgi:hypothetical protein